MQRFRLLVLALATAFIVGCGGGGSSSGSSSETTTDNSSEDVQGLETPNRVSIVDASN